MPKAYNFIKKESLTRVFLRILRNFSELLFFQKTSGGCFCKEDELEHSLQTNWKLLKKITLYLMKAVGEGRVRTSFDKWIFEFEIVLYKAHAQVIQEILFTMWIARATLPALHKNWSFPLRISSINVTKSVGNWGFGHIYWRNP